MLTLTPDEARVLGVLIEKQMTTPEQYPLSLNAVVAGSNQKNNRDPVTSLDENDCFAALEGLREKGLVVRSDMVGSRVNKYRHQAADVLRLRKEQQAILAELLLRGPQTLGELRGRASRMHPLESTDYVRQMLTGLMTERTDVLVKELPPEPGSRAERYAQLLCPNTGVTSDDSTEEPPAPKPEVEQASGAGLVARVETLEREVATLRAHVEKLSAALGEPLA